jgi:hypothetical protein
MRVVGLPILVLVALLASGLAPARAETPSIQPFVGSFEGTTLFNQGEQQDRDLRVIIRPFGEAGFSVRWRTIIHKTDEHKERGRTQVIYFKPSEVNPRIFAATQPEEAAGLADDDPLDGNPFAWARIVGKTLTVNVLTISPAGDYVMQSYDRTLTERGLALEFARVRNGDVEKRILGTLERGAE